MHKIIRELLPVLAIIMVFITLICAFTFARMEIEELDQLRLGLALEEENPLINRKNNIPFQKKTTVNSSNNALKRRNLIDGIELPEKPKLPPQIPPQTTTPPTFPATTTQKTTVTATTTASKTTSAAANEVNERGNGKFLFSIANPDPNYVGKPMVVEDRANLEGLVMGEFGTSYEGAVLVAQCIRDTMEKLGTRNTMVVKKKYGYTAPIKTNVSANVKRAVAFVFDDGGSAVQHEILYFYAFNLAKGTFHETQRFVIQFQNCRFFGSR